MKKVFKRFLPILAVLVLVLSMAIVPVSAATVDSLPEALRDLPSTNSDTDYYIITTADGSYYNLYHLSHGDFTVTSIFDGTYHLLCLNTSDFVSYDLYGASSSASSWDFMSKKTVVTRETYFTGTARKLSEIVYASFDIVDDTTGEVYYFSDFVGYCDGSACPATDMNVDGICDDCGSVLSLRLIGYPTLPTVDGKNLNSVVLQRDDGYFFMALTSDTSYSVSGSVGDNYLITIANEKEVNYVTYKCTDGKNWVNTNSGKAYSLSVGSSSSTLLDSTFDWYKDGSLFFQVPLWEKVEVVTQGEIPSLQNNLGGQIMTLVLCGVGLIALLVVLLLFGKVLRRYLPT